VNALKSHRCTVNPQTYINVASLPSAFSLYCDRHPSSVVCLSVIGLEEHDDDDDDDDGCGSGVPRNFVRRGVQQIQLRTEDRTGIWGR